MEIEGAGDRFVARWKKFKKKVTGQSRTQLPDRVRSTRMGSETVRMTPGMRKALPANQQKARGQARGKSTAKRVVRCKTCLGFYGALKSGRPRAHGDLSRGGTPCPGGGVKKGAPKKKTR